MDTAGEDVKYSYLWNCRHVLDGAQRIVLATDNDAPGRALAADLARRLGPERCWQVVWPIERKDANEVWVLLHILTCASLSNLSLEHLWSVQCLLMTIFLWGMHRY